MAVPTAEPAPPAPLSDLQAELPPTWERGLDIRGGAGTCGPPTGHSGGLAVGAAYRPMGMLTSGPGAGFGYGGALGGAGATKPVGGLAVDPRDGAGYSGVMGGSGVASDLYGQVGRLAVGGQVGGHAVGLGGGGSATAVFWAVRELSEPHMDSQASLSWALGVG